MNAGFVALAVNTLVTLAAMAMAGATEAVVSSES